MLSIWSEFVLWVTPILAIIWVVLMGIYSKKRNSPRRLYPPPIPGFLDEAKDAKIPKEKVDWAKEGF